MRSKQKTKTTVRNLKKENGDLTGNDTERMRPPHQNYLSRSLNLKWKILL